MRYILALLLMFNVGCASWQTPSEFKKKKRALENKIELLKLEKRKTMLEIQIDELEDKMMD
jgi:hypothetical protein